MRKSTILLPGCIALMLTIAQAQSVKSDHDIKTDFKKFHTYAWLAPGDSVLNRYPSGKLYAGYIMYAANQELKKRGLKMDTLRPDAVFVFYTSMEEITMYSQSPTLSVGVGVAGPGYYVGGAVPVAGGEITATVKEDGRLKYAMFDTSTGQLVWWGQGEKTFSLSDDIEAIIQDYTEKIFKKYPLKPSK